MRWIKFILSAIITGFLLYLLAGPISKSESFPGVPFSLGEFFSPFHGFWKQASPTLPTDDAELNLPELKAPVQVVIDDRHVPHVFAQNDHDLYFTQGYLHAKDRLWQMEFQVFAASGRLSEIFGSGPDGVILDMDRENRRKGMIFGAERSLNFWKSDPLTMNAAEAYSAGINAYIESLSERDLPIEYKLQNYKPEPWTPLKTAIFLKYMSNSLASGAYDLEHTNALHLWGPELVALLYPDTEYDNDPIVPANTRWRKRDAEPQPATPATYHPDSLLKSYTSFEKSSEIVGSNNWAVSGSKSATGKPMLANDPHLGLNLPAIWYEMQLTAPGTNSYGATFPGSPGVILGFNDSIAWGSTNGSQDVLDFYAVEFRDESKQECLFDGQWIPVKVQYDTFLVKGQAPFIDTVYYTHVGPVMYDERFGEQEVPLAIRWMAHEASNELRTFLSFNRSKNYADYLEALTTYSCPSQNFVFASAAGDIAIWQQGKYVNKWPQQGKFVLDASRKDHMWNEFIPQEQVPHVHNPAEGFVSSANQRPTTDAFPYYYNGRFSPYRGRRIHDLLASKDTFTVKDMMDYQLDNYSVYAADLLPILLEKLDTSSITGTRRVAYDMLANWEDFMYVKAAKEPTLFEQWWTTLDSMMWYDDIAMSDLPLRWPQRHTTIGLLMTREQFEFYGKAGDSVSVSRTELINRSFHAAMDDLLAAKPDPADWTWEGEKQTDILHLTRVLSPFSVLGIPTDGNAAILNATGKRHGPSWRMVVALGDEVEAYGIYPGGQSGNPGDAGYDAFVGDWAQGSYYKLWFMDGPQDARNTPIQHLIIKNAQTE
ncbi:penicillin acylase family protein [Pontibacter sp. G13]|uniref:penicillin acylase family protein n=1 Tax=Pontibacter sp. G13 TaxID=3074898 RepID=UPI00288C132A|nr:penicillin acylase family protein [Pontibacter sp. G13]WNJ15999.1 penicillin acylase family protein [Pontibacter sp. G13]